jgi:hypothetical protein
MFSRFMPPVMLLLLVIYSTLALSATPEIQLSDGSRVITPSGAALTGRSESDTLLVMGPWSSGAPFNGQFQDQAGSPQWNGWTHRDLTVPEDGNHWQAHSYNAEGLAGHGAGNLAAWCGSLDYPACDANDVDGGYGNNWDDALVWTLEVANPEAPSVVTLDAWVNLDLEPGYDYLTLLRRISDENNDFTIIDSYDGQLVNQHLSWQINIPAGEYCGPDGNQVELRLVVTSDVGWSDEDCDYPSAGACQIDDITVHLDNGNLTTFDDFEAGDLGSWFPVDRLGCGDFTQLRDFLQDVDDCRDNFSPQVCFIDDGVVVPGTGGTPCVDWCYGPGGFIVNWTGGLIAHDSMENAVMSPVMPWPEFRDGGLLEFDVYVHETMAMDSPLIFYGWDVRSAAGPDPEAINTATWLSDNYVYYGGPQYRRHNEDLTALLVPEATFVQVRLFAWDFPTWSWEWAPNGTPAPYFDNVCVKAVDTYGPLIGLNDLDLATDSFPASGVLDSDNLSSNSVRFDSGENVSTVPGGFEARDHLRMVISTQGEGTQLDTPLMHYRLIPNPVFDPVRTSGLPNSGTISGTTDRETSAFGFDLPDTGFFYPGDVIHYYFEASQLIPGGFETVLVPADTSGFHQNPWGANSQSPGLCAFDEKFSVRGLPSMGETGDHPNILIWDDACDPQFTAHLRHDVNQAQAWTLHGGFDLYRRVAKNGERSLSRDVTAEILAGYTAVFYFSGSNEASIFEYNGYSALADLALLAQWLEQNDSRGLFFNGDHILTQLDQTPEGQYILQDFLGADFVDDDLYPLINLNHTPQVLTTPAGPYSLSGIEEWVVTGYCPDSRSMTAVQPLDDAIILAEFASPSGQGGTYPYAALLVNEGLNQSVCFSMPYDLRRIQHLPGWDGDGLSLRSRILMSISSSFSGGGWPVVDMTPVPDRMVLNASAYPNPFNPSTTISFNLPRKGHLNLKIYNLRGELVKTLVDEPREAGSGRVVWSGDDLSGGSAASGVYFYELRFGDDVLSEKMMLVK